jgi:DNA-binding CsgD family transcriptional regulator
MDAKKSMDLLAGAAEQTRTLVTTLETARQELLALPTDTGVHAASADLSVGVDAALGVVAAALVRAESTVTLVDPGVEADWLWPEELERLVVAARTRGCVVRVMFGHTPCCRQARRIGAAVTDGGGEVRIVPTPAFPMLVVDGSTVLAPHRGPEAVPVMAAVTSPGVVALLRGFADLIWERAEPAPVWAGSGADLKRRLVELLTTGAKDERIARLLGISLRTCRRHIAEIMSDLGADSRFQAGANAARVGLIGAGPNGRRQVRWSASASTRPGRGSLAAHRRAV